jgi:ribosomal protein uL24|tara:strand:+ start:3220 stop:3798 length:579 start_codon:yes stop_codon:yes gene_type:complete
MSSPIDKGLRERQLSRGFVYPRSMPVKKGDRVMIVRGEGKSKSATAVSLVDRKARKVYVEGFTYFKSDGTELQRPIDASNLVIINPDWSDIRRRKILNRINDSVEWTEEVVSEFEAAEDEYEAETVEPSEPKVEESSDEEEETIVDASEPKTEDIDYSKMSVSELKELLKEKKLPVSGKKADLIERLQGDSK